MVRGATTDDISMERVAKCILVQDVPCIVLWGINKYILANSSPEIDDDSYDDWGPYTQHDIHEGQVWPCYIVSHTLWSLAVLWRGILDVRYENEGSIPAAREYRM